MIQKKVCMLGTYAVGKTSLVRRFVDSVYSDKYHTTIGVKVDKKIVSVGNQEVAMLLWDIEGTEDAHELRQSYLRGAAGYLLVADGTRPDTLEKAIALHLRAQDEVNQAPFLLVLNKSDLVVEWRIGTDKLADLKKRGFTVIIASAKSGAGVEDAFSRLAEEMIGE
jgi:small GTP-binding protein